MARAIFLLALIWLAMAGGCATVSQEQWVESAGVEMPANDARVGRCRAQLGRVVQGVNGVADGAIRIHVIDSDIPGAYSWSRGDIYVMRVLVDALTDDQLAAVIAHEMGHLLAERPALMQAAGLAGGGECAGRGEVEVEKSADAMGVRLLRKQGIPVGSMREALVVSRKMPNCPCNAEQMDARVAALGNLK